MSLCLWIDHPTREDEAEKHQKICQVHVVYWERQPCYLSLALLLDVRVEPLHILLVIVDIKTLIP